MTFLLIFLTVCQIFWGAWSFCEPEDFIAPPFITWAIELGWDVKERAPYNCWILTDSYTPEWRFCLDGYGEIVIPFIP